MIVLCVATPYYNSRIDVIIMIYYIVIYYSDILFDLITNFLMLISNVLYTGSSF